MNAFILALLLASTPITFEKSLKVDLDGDGTPETIELTALPTGVVAYDLSISGAKLGKRFVNASDDDLPLMAVVELDSSDKLREVLLVSGGHNDYRTFVLVRYANKKATELATFSGQIATDPEISGNGIVLYGAWQGFYERKVKLQANKKGALEPMSPELYAVDLKVKVKESFALYSSRTKKEILARVKPGSEIAIVAHDPSPKCKPSEMGYEGCDWFLVRSSTGLMGWVELGELDEGAELPWAG